MRTDRRAVVRAIGCPRTLGAVTKKGCRWTEQSDCADRSLLTISSPTPHDDRSVDAYVSGPAALLVAKAYKLYERIIDAEKGRTARLPAKDAGDVYRIMATFRAGRVAESFATPCKAPRVGAVATEGSHYRRRLFGAAATSGTELAVQALAGDIPESRIRVLVPSLVAVQAPAAAGSAAGPDSPRIGRLRSGRWAGRSGMTARQPAVR